ncbi:MAG: HAD hydrolase family protein [Erysipelotrichaceae bacterium]|nr:HAD hydrolase family protein [Erysipelotrichaceae bacterium]
MKLLVSDLDGTLYTRDEQQNQANIIALNEWIAAGNLFAVATARRIHHYSIL